MNSKRPFVLHPFLFALFPIIFQLASNIQVVKLIDAAAPTLITIGSVIVLIVIFLAIFRHLRKAAIVATLFVTAFFLYGPCLIMLQATGIRTEFLSAYHKELIIGFLILLVIASTFIVIRKKTDLKKSTSILNLIGGLLFFIQVSTLSYNLATAREIVQEPTMKPIRANSATNQPDIIYIFVDGYARQDILKEIYDVDNSDFLQFLRRRGFYVADSSYSNYAQTLLSLASSLNSDYLDILQEQYSNWKSRRPVRVLIEHNQIFQYARGAGYKIVTFKTGVSGTEVEQYDLQLSPHSYDNKFISHLIAMTPLPLIIAELTSPFKRHYERVLYVLDKLPKIDEIDGPRFIFAHIVSPHPPFLFDDTGGFRKQHLPFTFGDGSHYYRDGGTIDEYIDGYRDQVKTVNGLLQTTIDRILENYGDNPPIIILQADHGSGAGVTWNELDKVYFKERMSILNALYLPNMNHDQLYPSISPVNTFRVVLNNYFGGRLELLDDKNYFSTWDYPFKFHDVTKILADDNWVWDSKLQKHVLKEK